MFTRERNFKFSRNTYERVWLDDDHTTCTHRKVGEYFYEVDLINEELLKVTRDDESKTILVRPDTEGFVYSCKVGFIAARNKAEGLYETLAKCIGNDGHVWNSATLYTVCDHIIDRMRPAPKRPDMSVNHERLLDALKWSSNHKGNGIDVADGWIAFASYSDGLSYAELWHPESRTRLTFPVTGGFTKSQFVSMAANFLMDEYSDLVSKAA